MWVKKIHTPGIFVIKVFFGIICKFKYNFKFEKCKEKGPFLIVGNHSIAHDPFMCVQLFKGPIYFMTSDELYRMGFLSKMIKLLLAPIPKSKSLRDTSSIKICLSVAKQKKNICIYPEGATTYCGEQCYIDPAITKLAKKINYKIAIVNLEGGFQSRPKFGTGARKGRIKAYVKRIIPEEEVQSLSNEELYEIIKNDTKVDLIYDTKFKCKTRAEHLQTTLYYCSDCDSFNTTNSKKHDFYCEKCGVNYFVDEYLNLHKNDEVTSIASLYNKQQDKINSLSLEDVSKLVYEDIATLFEVVNYVKIPKTKGVLKLIDNVIVINDYQFELKDITASCTTGPDMVDIYINDKIYQLRGDGRFSALKYMNIIYRYKNLTNDNDSKYLGV